jgi:hypothetical protein
MTAWPQPNDTSEVTALIARIRTIEEKRRALQSEARQAEQLIDEIRRAARPTFPTDEHRAGLTEATRRMREGIKPTSHLGDPTPTYAVVVDGHRGWLNIRDGAPYAATGQGSKLWEFTDAEIDEFLGILVGHGWSISDWWRADGGVSITVR